jgi:hypothetical protein
MKPVPEDSRIGWERIVAPVQSSADDKRIPEHARDTTPPKHGSQDCGVAIESRVFPQHRLEMGKEILSGRIEATSTTGSVQIGSLPHDYANNLERRRMTSISWSSSSPATSATRTEQSG